MQYPLYALIYFRHSILIVFDYKILQLTSHHNQNEIEHLEIIHVILSQCVTFHHGDLYQVRTHVVGEKPTFG